LPTHPTAFPAPFVIASGAWTAVFPTALPTEDAVFPMDLATLAAPCLKDLKVPSGFLSTFRSFPSTVIVSAWICDRARAFSRSRDSYSTSAIFNVSNNCCR